jgi:lipopolysaccharide transport system permease protein
MDNSSQFNTVIIEPGYTKKQYWKDLYLYRDLFFFLAWRDILVRYKQTSIGIAWAILQPLFTVIIFTFVFGKIANLPSGEIPYFIIVLCGLLPWQFFASGFAESSNSLITNSNLITKVYFPRIIIPLGSIIVFFVDFLISATILLSMIIFYHISPNLNIFFLPLFILLLFTFTAGAGLLIGSLNVKFRDFRYIIPFITQLGLYVSPVGYSTSVIPDKWKLLYYLNPMAGIIDGFRWSILGDKSLYFPGIFTSIMIIILFFSFSLLYFRRVEKNFADII